MSIIRLALLQNVDLLSLGVAMAATVILAFTVYLNNKNNLSSKLFLAFSLITSVWGAVNYSAYQISDPTIALWFFRLEIFLAIVQAYLLFSLFYVFPDEEKHFPDWFKYAVNSIAAFGALATLTPWVFERVAETDKYGRVISIQNGPAIGVFGMVASGLVLSGIFLLAKKIATTHDKAKKPLIIILIGTLITFSLVINFNFVLPTISNNSSFISLGGLFFFPFIICMSYAIIRHKLLQTKILSTEIAVFVLTSAVFVEVIISNSLTILIFRSFLFLLLLSLGIILIRSVIQEVQQREELEKLTTELADANQQLKALDKARAEFISIASHQLRTPPATVKWYLSGVIAGDFGKLPKDVTEALSKADRANNLLISLIEDILNVSRIERGKMEFLFEKVDIFELTHITYEQLLPLAEEKHLKMTLKAQSDHIPLVTADREKLRQVINNLVDNAIKYTKSGSIQIRLTYNTEEVRFEVEDSGKGIPTEDLSTIFEKYTRGKESIQQSAGLGLGLYVAKVIINQHQGKIWVESGGIGKGSHFIFTLPLNSNLKASSFDFAKQA